MPIAQYRKNKEMISLLCESTFVLFFYLLFRRLFLNRVSRKTTYAFGMFPLIGLLAALFLQIDTDFWTWIATRLVVSIVGHIHRIMRMLGNPKVSERNYSTALINLMGTDDRYLYKVWLSGIIALACCRIIKVLIFVGRAKKNSSIIKDDEYPEILIRESLSVRIPFLLWNTVFIPVGLRDDEEKYHYVMIHEYVHYKQGDPMWNFFRVCLATVFWFHPLVWIACWVSKGDSEFACDETALTNFSQQQKNDYCMVILSICTGLEFKALGFLESSGLSGNGVVGRIKQIKKEGRQHRGGFVILLVLCVLLFVSGVFTTFFRWKQQRKAEMYGTIIENPKAN